MKNPWHGLSAIAALCICGSAVAANAHLFSDESKLLHSGSVTVLFVDPDQELGVYLKTHASMNTPYNGGAVGAIATGMIDSHHMNEFVEAMQPYADVIGKQHFTDQEYAVIHDLLGAQSWMQKADWQRFPAGTDRRRLLKMMKDMHTQAALLVVPETLIRDDVDQMLVGYNVELYVKDPYEDYGVKRLRHSEFIIPSPDPASAAFPSLDYTKTGVDELTAQNLKDFFADGGTQLGQYFQGALPTLKSQLTYYFTGVMPPAAATVPAAAAATVSAAGHR